LFTSSLKSLPPFNSCKIPHCAILQKMEKLRGILGDYLCYIKLSVL